MKKTNNILWILLVQILVCHLAFAQKAKIWLDSSSLKKVYTPYEPIKGLIYIKNVSNELLFCHGQSEYLYTEDFYDANVYDPSADHNSPFYSTYHETDDIHRQNTNRNHPSKESYKSFPRTPSGPCKEGARDSKGYACLFPGMTYIIGGAFAQWFCFDKTVVYPNGEYPLGSTNLNYPLPPGKYTVWQSAGVSSCDGGVFDWEFEIKDGESQCNTEMWSWLHDARINYWYYKNVDSVINAHNKMIFHFIDTCQNQVKIDMAASMITFHKVNGENCQSFYPATFNKIIPNRALCLYLLKQFIDNTKVHGFVRDERKHATYRFAIHKELIKYLLKKDRLLAETFFGDLYFNEVYYKDRQKWMPENIKPYLFTVAQMEELHQLFK
ncbi:MAG: hypothetical protein H7329_20315 [Opitutaceae bacterium]|nr:hypothetical protein [Cytophagales bacterium]